MSRCVITAVANLIKGHPLIHVTRVSVGIPATMFVVLLPCYHTCMSREEKFPQMRVFVQIGILKIEGERISLLEKRWRKEKEKDRNYLAVFSLKRELKRRRRDESVSIIFTILRFDEYLLIILISYPSKSIKERRVSFIFLHDSMIQNNLNLPSFSHIHE